MDEKPLLAPSEVDSSMEAESLTLRRPFGVTLLLWLVLCVSAWGLLRFLAALRWWDVLSRFHAGLRPLYLSITGAGWAVAGIVLIASIWSTKRWSYPAIPIFAVLWLSEYWIERLLFESQRANLLFTIVASILFLVIAFTSTFNRSTKIFLTKSEEHEQSNKHSASA